MKEGTIITDPLGNEVHFQQQLCLDLAAASEEAYDPATTVISRPALIIEVPEESTPERHYYRSLGWQLTLLVSTRFHLNAWHAFQCRKNPSTELLRDLLMRGKQIF